MPRPDKPTIVFLFTGAKWDSLAEELNKPVHTEASLRDGADPSTCICSQQGSSREHTHTCHWATTAPWRAILGVEFQGPCSLPAWNKLCAALHIWAAPCRSSDGHEHCRFTHRDVPQSPWQKSPVSLLRFFWVSCLASANWDPPGMPRFKAPVSRQKKQKAWFKDMPLWKHRCFTLTPFWCFSGSHRISSSQGRQRPRSGLW